VSLTKDRAHHWGVGNWGVTNPYKYVEDSNLVLEHSGTMTNMEAAEYSTDFPGKVAYSMKAMQFDGVDEYLNMGNALAFERTDSFSFSFWFKTAFSAREQMVVAKQIGAVPQGYWLQLGMTSCNIALALSNSWPASALAAYEGTGWWQDGEWHHAVVTYPGDNNPASIKFYVDGIQRPTIPFNDTLAASIVSAADFRVGDRQGDTGTKCFAGALSQVSVYDKVLSAAEVVWMYNSGTPRDLAGVGAPSNLVGWWHMGDGDGLPFVTDHAPIPHNGNCVNVEATDFVYDSPYLAGGLVRSLTFDGIDEYVAMSDVLAFERTDPFSISQWVRFTAVTGCHFVSKLLGGPSYRGYATGVLAGTGLTEFVLLNNNVANVRIAVDSLNPINDGAWHHVVWTYDGSSLAAGCVLYIDGALAPMTVVTDALNATILSASTFGIGARVAGPAWFFTGNMTEVSVYNKVLSLAEVQAMYNAGVPPDLTRLPSAPNLVGYWKMGEEGL